MDIVELGGAVKCLDDVCDGTVSVLTKEVGEETAYVIYPCSTCGTIYDRSGNPVARIHQTI